MWIRAARQNLPALWAVMIVTTLLAACSPAAPAPAAPPPATTGADSAAANPDNADLSGIKDYLLAQTDALVAHARALQTATDNYFALVEAHKRDYSALWEAQGPAVVAELTAARTAWRAASPAYEKAEGIVAGTPSLADFDVILDAGASGADDPENAAPIDLTLPDGRLLPRPGNLFGVTESALWGTFAAYTITDVSADWDADGTLEFGENLPDADVLKAAADALLQNATELDAAAQAWQPTQQDAFTALAVMVPTMSEYFASWRDSRFVAGDASTQRDFVVISRLADVQDILSGLQVVYAQVQPVARSVQPDQAALVAGGLTDLMTFVAGIYAEETAGRRFTPEEADILGAEAQNRATAITGQISQIAALLGVTIENE